MTCQTSDLVDCLVTGCDHSKFICMFWYWLMLTILLSSLCLGPLLRLTVVSREAKKGQSDRQKQNVQRTTVWLLHKQTFSSFDVIITVNISRAVPTFKPALKTQNLLANIIHHPKDQSNRLSSLSFPAWSKSMNFVFTFFFSDGSSQFSFLNRHISLRLAVLLGLLT